MLPKMQKTVKQYNIFSKPLFDTVNGFVNDLIIGLVVLWESQEYHDVLDEYLQDAMEELRTDGKITNYKVILKDDILNKTMDIHIRYRQKNCLANSTIDYNIIM